MDYTGTAFFRTSHALSKALWRNEMQDPDAWGALAPCLQRNLAYVLNPGVGRLRRAEAGSG